MIRCCINLHKYKYVKECSSQINLHDVFIHCDCEYLCLVLHNPARTVTSARKIYLCVLLPHKTPSSCANDECHFESRVEENPQVTRKQTEVLMGERRKERNNK